MPNRFILILALAATCSGQAPNKYGCESPIDTNTIIEKLDAKWKRADPAYFKELQAKFADLVNKHAGDYWVHKSYIEAVGNLSSYVAYNDFVERYRTMHEDAPDDVRAAYLYAVALGKTKPDAALAILQNITVKAPDLAPAWLVAARLGSSPSMLRSFLKACPDSVDPKAVNLAATKLPPVEAAAYSSALRSRIHRGFEPHYMHILPALWQMEAKSSSPSGLETLRKNIEGDLDSIRKLDGVESTLSVGERYLRVLAHGLPLRMGPGMLAPKITRKIPPEYSEEAQKLKVEGSVALDIIVDWEGKPALVVVNQSLGYGLDEEAVRAVQHWQFIPATLNGTPVNVFATSEVLFRMRK